MILNNCILKDFIDLTLEEKKMVLFWRNSSKVKKWMYTNDDISLDNHLKFIDSLKNNNLKKYFVVIHKEQYIGVIDFTNINNNSLDMGLYSNPNVKGVGKILLETIVKYSFDILNVNKINAEVFANNEKAYGLYESFNFNKINEKAINNKKVNCMELIKNDN